MRSLCLYSLWVAATALSAPLAYAANPVECTDWAQQHPDWLWCDDFESDTSLEQNYFDVYRPDGRLRVSTDAAFAGNASLKGTYIPGSTDAGSIKLSFGKTPVAPKRYTDSDFEEVYWRFYMRTSPNWVGNGYKVSRATIFTSSSWTQAAIGHLWEDSPNGLGLGLDPVSGIIGSQVVTTKYNDFDHLQWLGKRNGVTQVYSPENRGLWSCIELRMKLNTPGQSNGVFEHWVNGQREVQINNLNWRGSYTTYGINAILLENYRNEPPSQTQDRYFDNFVVSRQPIGCMSGKYPKPPADLRTQ